MKENKIKTEKDNTLGYDKQTHPAFGMIGINNVNGNKKLFGSSVKHHHFIDLEIKTAKRYINGYSEHYHGGELICSVSLTHYQLAEMLFNANHGDGVPCTIGFVINEGNKPEIPEEDDFESMKEYTNQLKDKLNNLFEQSKELCSEVEKITSQKAPLKKADKDRINFLAMKIKQDIKSNLPYASECFDEKVEKTISKGKAEFEAFVNNSLMNKGMEVLKGEATEQIKLLLKGEEDE